MRHFTHEEEDKKEKEELVEANICYRLGRYITYPNNSWTSVTSASSSYDGWMGARPDPVVWTGTTNTPRSYRING